MTYTVSSDSAPQISLNENDTLKSVLQNVYLILVTKVNTVPMYRNFGIPMEFIDKPLTAAETIMATEIREAIEEFEPRAGLVDVAFEPSKHGAKITVKVEVKINEKH